MKWLLVVIMTALLTLAPVAAQDDDDPITVIDALGNEVTINDASRIITLGGAVTETVSALGLGDRIVAVDESSIYPEAVTDLPIVGYLRFLSAEPVLSVDPTLIIATEDAGPSETVQQLEAAGVTFLVVPAEDTIEGAIEKIRAIAIALGREEQGELLIGELEEDVAFAANLLDSVESTPRVMFFFLRGRAVLTVSGEGTGADQMLRLAGAENAVTGYEGYQPITAEAVIAAAPDIIMTTSNGVESIGGIEEVLQLPGVAQTPAAENGRIIASMDDLYLLGFTSRFGDALLELTYRIHEDIPRPVFVVAQLDGRFQSVASALETLDLDEALSDAGPYTLFAPVDMDVPVDADVLLNHVVSGTFTAADLAEVETLNTLGGATLTVAVSDSGAVTINGVTVILPDIVASNGVIHGVENVLSGD